MSCNCTDGHEESKHDYQYAAKVVVGEIPLKSDQQFPLPGGKYYTKINVHNPSRCDCVTFKWKVAVGEPGLKVGPVSIFRSATLCPDEALEIVNGDLMNAAYPDPRILVGHDLADDIQTGKKEKGTESRDAEKVKPSEAVGEFIGLPRRPSHFEGWLVIETPQPLDVVSVYGSSGDSASGIRTFHTERVPPRIMVPCSDLNDILHTGTAIWEIKTPGQTDYQPAYLTKPIKAWTATAPGSVWLTPAGNNSAGEIDSQPGGIYSYLLTFKLCTGFEKPNISINYASDDSARVLLNGVVKSVGASNFTSLKSLVINSGFKAGDNTLEVQVSNSGGGPTGLSLSGTISAIGGQCPGANGEPGVGIAKWKCPGITYMAHVKRILPVITGNDGTLAPVSDGQMAGTTGQNRRLEAYWAWLSGTVPPGVSIEYQGYKASKSPSDTQGGWTGWRPENTICGTTNDNRRLEAIRMRFTIAPPTWSLNYRVHIRENIFDGGGSDIGPNKDGEICGTTGKNRRMEALYAWVTCH